MKMPDEKVAECSPTELVGDPFVKGTMIQYAWDSVSLTTALECMKRYQLRILQNWVSKQPDSAIALAFGILVHSGVEEYHRARFSGKDWNEAVDHALCEVMVKKNRPEDKAPLWDSIPTDETIEQMKSEAADDPENADEIELRNSKVRTRYHLVRALVWYFEQYRYDPMPVHRLADGRPAVEHSFRVGTGRSLSSGHELLVAGHLDKVVKMNGQLFVTDVKTTKSLTRSWFQGFDLSHQMTGYTFGGSIALHEKIGGVWIDGIALQVGGVKFGRAPTYRTPSQMGEYLDLLEHIGEQAERAFEYDYYPMNTAACMFCEFKPVCRQPPEARRQHLMMLFRQEPGPGWNPLRSR